MNNIHKQQNTPHSLSLLAAQRQFYSEAKRWQAISVFLGVPTVILWSFLVAAFPKLDFWAGLWGGLVTLLDPLIFSRLQKNNQKKAAMIQQIFDCEVLEFKWEILNCGDRIEPDIIIVASDKFKMKNSNYLDLCNWYPAIAEHLPIHFARIVCQRCNVKWDTGLRDRYSNLIIIILCILTLSVFLIACIGEMTTTKFFLAFFLPLMPALSLGFRQYVEHKEAITQLNLLREKINTLTNEIEANNQKLTPKYFEDKSYELQSQIYDSRRLSPLIFNWFYNLSKSKDEEQMNQSAMSLVKKMDNFKINFINRIKRLF
jgi:SMODS-associating 4TM effector domain